MSSLRILGPLYLMAAAAAAIAVGQLPGPLRIGAGYGLGVAAGAGALSLALMAWASRKPLSHALAVLAGGFLVRAALLGVVLLLCHREGVSMVACAAAFLGFFALGQVLEIALVSGKLSAPAQETQA